MRKTILFLALAVTVFVSGCVQYPPPEEIKECSLTTEALCGLYVNGSAFIQVPKGCYHAPAGAVGRDLICPQCELPQSTINCLTEYIDTPELIWK